MRRLGFAYKKPQLLLQQAMKPTGLRLLPNGPL